MNKTSSERPNRVVTCQVCGVQMPQRYLPGHMQSQHPAAAQAQDAAQAPAADDAPPAEESAAMLVCPACAGFVAEADFARHMQANHSNWCPLCQAQPKDLAEHLRSRHLLKPIQPPPLYERAWQTQKRFLCLGCKKKVSVWSYPKHEGPHGATRGLAQQIEKTRKPKE